MANIRLFWILLRACLTTGFLLFYLNSYSGTQSNLDSLVHVLESNKNLNDTSKLRVLREIFSDNSIKPAVRLNYLKEASRIARKLDDPIWLYTCSLNEGYVYKKQGDLQQALKSMYESAGYAKKVNDKLREAIAYGAIASVYRVEDNYIIALSYYNKSITAFREIGDSTRLATFLMNTGELYRVNHVLDTALLYFDEAGKIFNLRNYKIGNAYNLGNIGLVYAEQGEYDLAEENIVAATKILKELGEKYPIAVYNVYMADIYKEKGDLPRALKYAQKSYQLAKEDGLKEQMRDASLKLAELYEAVDDYKNAFLFQKQYIEYRDSINNEETIRKMADLRTEFEVSQKQAEVDLLNQQKRTHLIIVAGLVVLLVAIGALAWMFHKRNEEKKITNKILAEQKEQLELQHIELEKLNETKDRFFSIISHDLRGPVNAFKGLSSIIKFSVEEEKYNEIPAMVDRIETSAAQLSFLLDNLLDWAVNQQGQFPFTPEKIELVDIVDSVSAVFQNMAHSKGIELKTTYDDNIVITADRNSVRAIVRNLVNNALKFTQSDGVVTVSATTSYDRAIIKIADTGVGISEDKLESLFKLDGGKSIPGTDGEKGLGLGLRLVFEFVNMNNGSLNVESEIGKGTTFSVELPLS